MHDNQSNPFLADNGAVKCSVSNLKKRMISSNSSNKPKKNYLENKY